MTDAIIARYFRLSLEQWQALPDWGQEELRQVYHDRQHDLSGIDRRRLASWQQRLGERHDD